MACPSAGDPAWERRVITLLWGISESSFQGRSGMAGWLLRAREGRVLPRANWLFVGAEKKAPGIHSVAGFYFL